MKSIIKILAMAFILLMACRKDFIEITPSSTVTVDILFKTDKDFQDAVIGAYNGLQGAYGNLWMYGDLRGDDNRAGIVSSTPGYAFDIDEFYIDNDASILSNTWRDYYRIINRVNLILSMITEVDPSVVTNKERHIAEARFIRALSYFNLVRIFGDVPKIITPVIVQESYTIGRENVNNIYNEIIIPDLIAAVDGLSVKYTGSDVGRPTKGAAKALLGKVYLTIHDFQKS